MLTGACVSLDTAWHGKLGTLGGASVGARASSFQLPEQFVVTPKMVVARRWREFFADPSQWWDHRAEKGSPRHPDFKHKVTGESLWLNGNHNPAWVDRELSETAEAGGLQEHIFAWNKRLAKLVKSAQYGQALELFNRLQQRSIAPDKFTFAAIIKVCARLRSLEETTKVHQQIIEDGYESDLHLSSSLVDTYAKCGSIDDAIKVFDNMVERDLVSWNVIIAAHARSGRGQQALELFEEMQKEGIEPDAVTFVAMLNACASLSALEEGSRVHEQTVSRGLDRGIFVGSGLIDMYATCGSIDDARAVFDRISARDVVCWNAMSQGYLKCGAGQKVLELFGQMQVEGTEPNIATFLSLFRACASLRAVKEGRYFHELAVQRGLGSAKLVGDGLIHMYTDCGRMRDAWKVFEGMSLRDVLSWNAMLHGCLKCGRPKSALRVYEAMRRENVEADLHTFVGVLKACASLEALEEGRTVHRRIIHRGWGSRSLMQKCLINMYSKCGRMKDALVVFTEMPDHHVDCYNAMINGYVRCGQERQALDLYLEMQRENVEPDAATLVGVLDACAGAGALKEGTAVHAQICDKGFESNAAISRGLAKMYTVFRSRQDTRFARVGDEPIERIGLTGHMMAGLQMTRQL